MVLVVPFYARQRAYCYTAVHAGLVHIGSVQQDSGAAVQPLVEVSCITADSYQAQMCAAKKTAQH